MFFTLVNIGFQRSFSVRGRGRGDLTLSNLTAPLTSDIARQSPQSSARYSARITQISLKTIKESPTCSPGPSARVAETARPAFAFAESTVVKQSPSHSPRVSPLTTARQNTTDGIASSFDPVHLLIYMVDLTSYCSVVSGKSEMQQQFEHFANTINHKLHLETSVSLILNKYDVFVDMLSERPLQHQIGFSDFKPTVTSEKKLAREAATFIEKKLIVKNKNIYGRLLNVVTMGSLIESAGQKEAIKALETLIKEVSKPKAKA